MLSFFLRNLHDRENLQNRLIVTSLGRAEVYNESQVLMGYFNGFDSRGLSELTNLELLHTKPTRGTNVLDKTFTSNRFLVDREPVTFLRVVNTDHLVLGFFHRCRKSRDVFK